MQMTDSSWVQNLKECQNLSNKVKIISILKKIHAKIHGKQNM